jgi:hypothetical protein
VVQALDARGNDGVELRDGFVVERDPVLCCRAVAAQHAIHRADVVAEPRVALAPSHPLELAEADVATSPRSSSSMAPAIGIPRVSS